MGRYIVKRLLQLILVVFGVSFILFTILNLTPGDPAMLILGDSATAETIAAKRAELGLDQPFFTRYFSYLGNIFLHGDFGRSYRSGMPVFQEVFARFPNTLRLALMTIALSAVFGILFGVLSAVKQYSWVDNATLAFTLAITSIPGFWLGLMLILIFAVRLHWFPVSGGTDSFKGFILPAIAGSFSYMANTIRQTRASMLDVIHQLCPIYGCTWDGYLGGINRNLYNNPRCAELAREAIGRAVGEERITSSEPRMGSETMSRTLLKWPGEFARLGTGNASRGITGRTHTPEFDIDESALSLGTAAHIAYALAFLESDLDVSADAYPGSFARMAIEEEAKQERIDYFLGKTDDLVLVST